MFPSWTYADGGINLTDNGGFAQIGHASCMGGASTIGGDIFVQSGGNITLSNNGDYARIGNGGVFDAAFLSSSVKILAGISLISKGDQMINENGPLTLVIDNLFPTPFSFGYGSLYLDLLSSLAATGECAFIPSPKIKTPSWRQSTGSRPFPGPSWPKRAISIEIAIHPGKKPNPTAPLPWLPTAPFSSNTQFGGLANGIYRS